MNRMSQLRRLEIPVLFGDAANSEILSHAALERARALVVAVPDDTAALSIVAAARRLGPSLHIITRASRLEGVHRLKKAGAVDVVWPELEGGVEIVRRTLLRLECPAHDVQRYSDAVRREGLDAPPLGDTRARVLKISRKLLAISSSAGP